LLIAVAIWLSLNRRRTILQLGIGLVIAFALARLLIQFGVDPIFASMRNATARDVLQATTDSVLSGLATLTVILAAAGLVVAVAAFLAGEATGDRRQARLRDA